MNRKFHILVEKGAARLDQYLASATGESRSFIAHQIEKGNVVLNGRTTQKNSMKLREGDTIEVTLEEITEVSVSPIKGPLEILHEDADLLVLNKPQGLVVHPAPGTTEATLVHFLLYHLRNNPDFAMMSEVRPGIVHRLDRGTSGVLVVAKTRKAKESLGEQFKARTLRKHYEAVVWGEIPERGVFESPIGRHPVDRKRMSSKAKMVREARTEFERISIYGRFSHVSLFPRTGRTHQLRVHLSEDGFPIVGDPVYGARVIGRRMQELPKKWLSGLEKIKETVLHAKSLRFQHPTRNMEMFCEAKRPASFDRLLEFLKEAAR